MKISELGIKLQLKWKYIEYHNLPNWIKEKLKEIESSGELGDALNWNPIELIGNHYRYKIYWTRGLNGYWYKIQRKKREEK